MAEPSKLEERLKALPLDELEDELRKLQAETERIRNMTFGDVVQELGLSLWEWLGELAFRLSEYADYSDLEPRIPPARVIDQGDRTRSFRALRRRREG